MRKSVSTIIAIMLFFTVGIAYGQGYSFRVLANKGQNKVKKAGTAAAVALKTGATLNSGDELIAVQGAYIGLMHKSGKTLEVRTAGTKRIADLEKMVSTKTASVASRYADFIAKKMNEKENSNYRARLNATGAVKRGGEGTIDVLLSKDVSVLGDQAIVTWDVPKDLDASASYVVVIENIFDEEIYKEETNTNSVTLDFASEQMQNEEGLYILTVKVKDNEEVVSGKIGIKKINSGDASQYADGLNALKSEVSEETALGKVIYASYFEEQGLILDALTKIEEAIRMSPEVEDFKELKKDILERNGIKIFEERNENESKE